ncbi:MAG: hypothetical protein Q8M40_05375 [Legionella sp.]|nr:hypothetical protein [Legionella sp.]
MSHFDTIYEAAIKRDARLISLLLMSEGISIDVMQGLALTPAGLLAQNGEWESTRWLMQEFGAKVGNILYGAIIGGHIKYYEPTQDDEPGENSKNTAMRLIWSKYSKSNDHEMTIAFAQLGLVHWERLQENIELINFAILGSAYTNNRDLIDTLFTLEQPNKSEALANGIIGAACGNHRVLMYEYMKMYERHYSHHENYKIQVKNYALKGAAQGEQIDLIIEIGNNFIEPGSITMNIDAAIYELISGNNIQILLKLLNKLDKDHDLYAAQITATRLNKPKILEALIHYNLNNIIDYETIAHQIKPWAKKSDDLLRYLAQFNSPNFVKSICAFFHTNPIFNLPEEVKQKLTEIQNKALAIIELKQKYDLETIQALFYQKYQYQENNSNRPSSFPNKEELSLNKWQLNDLIKKIGKKIELNEVKEKLIKRLERYMSNLSFWKSNHGERCKSFLLAIKDTPGSKEVTELVSTQYSLFHNRENQNQTKDPNPPKHQQKLKNNTQDEFYQALKEYYDTMTTDKLIVEIDQKSETFTLINY